MELFSLQFVIFLAAALVAYYACGRVLGRGQWVVLLVASIVFYGLAASWPFVGLLVVVALITWGCGLACDKLEAASKAARKATKDRAEKKALRAQYDKRKTWVLVGGLVACLGILGYLKYWNVILFNFGLEPATNSLGIVLPLGISYYTFQSLGYLIDVRNGQVKAETSFWRHLLFVSYFPQLIMGPINKHDQVASQLFETHAADAHGIERGLMRLAYGVLKKFAISNMLIINVNAICNHVDPGMPGSVVVLGVLTYSLQMYADFSGGIDMVEGVSELFGIEMAQNFRQPYLSTSLAEFWRRWHMSLGAWMRDHVFYPLALTKPMQRFGKWTAAHMSKHVGRTLPACVANVVVFLVVGLWHGAEWHFLAWGLANGVIIALADLLQPTFQRMNELLHVNVDGLPHRVFAIVRTFLVVNFTRYFDCILDVGVSLLALRNTVFHFAPELYLPYLAQLGVESAGISRIAVAAYVVVAVVDILTERGMDVREKLLGWHFVFRLALYLAVGALVALSFAYGMNGGGAFAYANF